MSCRIKQLCTCYIRVPGVFQYNPYCFLLEKRICIIMLFVFSRLKVEHHVTDHHFLESLEDQDHGQQRGQGHPGEGQGHLLCGRRRKNPRHPRRKMSLKSQLNYYSGNIQQFSVKLLLWKYTAPFCVPIIFHIPQIT